MLKVFVLISAVCLSLVRSADNPRHLKLPPLGSRFYNYRFQCGKANLCEKSGDLGCLERSPGQDYIKGGIDVSPFKYPWNTLMTYENSEGKDILVPCHGTLISMRHILTAIHCFDGVQFINLADRYGIRFDTRKYPIYALLGTYVRGSSKIVPGTKGKELYTLLDGNLERLRGFGFGAKQRIIEIKIPPRTPEPHNLALLRIKDVPFSDYIRPICLPFDGIPISRQYSYAGWGETESEELQNHDWILSFWDRLESLYPKGLRTVFDPKGKVNIKRASVYPVKQQEIGNFEVKSLAEGPSNPANGHWAHNGTGVSTLFSLNVTDKGTPCKADSGGALMWQNLQSGRFFITGVLWFEYNAVNLNDGIPICSDQNKQRWSILTFTKVTYFLDYIYREMNPDGFANNKCRPDSCKDPNTTYVTKNGLLSAPCGYVDGGHGGSFCMTGDRENVFKLRNLSPKTKDEFLNKGFAECVPCVGGKKNWNYQQWMNEITLGSFSQGRYFGKESPYEAFAKSYYKGIWS